jgi:hypothetical protein
MALKGRPFARIGAVLKSVAPTLLTGFGGPAGALVATIAKKAMGDPAMTDEALEQAVEVAATTPEGLQKLKEIEADLKKAELEHDFKFEELTVDDRKDARAREVALKDSTTKILAFAILGAFIGMGLAVLMGWATAESTIAGTIIGYMSAKAEQVVSYYFGSSAGSRHKDAIIERQGK